MLKALAFGLLLLVMPTMAGQKMKVKIIGRQGLQNGYTQTLPGRATTNSTASANCGTIGNTANCTGNGQQTTTIRPPVQRDVLVTGANIALLLPDGRVAIVGCQVKRDVWSGGPRDCRTPQGNDLEAEFDGDNAKLKWPIGIDGKKTQSETYKVQQVLNNQKDFEDMKERVNQSIQ